MLSILIVLTRKAVDLKVQCQEYQTQLLQIRHLELEKISKYTNFAYKQKFPGILFLLSFLQSLHTSTHSPPLYFPLIPQFRKAELESYFKASECCCFCIGAKDV